MWISDNIVSRQRTISWHNTCYNIYFYPKNVHLFIDVFKALSNSHNNQFSLFPFFSSRILILRMKFCLPAFRIFYYRKGFLRSKLFYGFLHHFFFFTSLSIISLDWNIDQVSAKVVVTESFSDYSDILQRLMPLMVSCFRRLYSLWFL